MANRSPSARCTPVYPYELSQNARPNMGHGARQEDNVTIQLDNTCMETAFGLIRCYEGIANSRGWHSDLGIESGTALVRSLLPTSALSLSLKVVLSIFTLLRKQCELQWSAAYVLSRIPVAGGSDLHIVAISTRRSTSAAMPAIAFAYQGPQLTARNSIGPTHTSRLKLSRRYRQRIRRVMHDV